MDPSISHRLVHIINNCAPDYTIQIVTFFFLLFLFLFKFFINTRENQEMHGVEPETSGLLTCWLSP